VPRAELAFPHISSRLFSPRTLPEQKPCIILHLNLHAFRQTIDSPEAFLDVESNLRWPKRSEKALPYERGGTEPADHDLRANSNTQFFLSRSAVCTLRRSVRSQLGVDHFRSVVLGAEHFEERSRGGGPAAVGRRRKGIRTREREREREREPKRNSNLPRKLRRGRITSAVARDAMT